jgi:hypothetical protein
MWDWPKPGPSACGASAVASDLVKQDFDRLPFGGQARPGVTRRRPGALFVVRCESERRRDRCARLLAKAKMDSMLPAGRLRLPGA